VENADQVPFNADAIAGTIAHIAAQEGDAAAVAVLASSSPLFRYVDRGHGWNSDITEVALFLELPTQLYAQLFKRRAGIEKSILEMLQPLISAYDGWFATAVNIVPTDKPPANWRDMAKAWLAGEGTNNQGRIRSDNIASRSVDGLLFRSQPEIHLYRALKAAGVSFAPLPVFVRGGKEYRRIEPDFVIVHQGIIAIVEVDGDTVHQESPADAHARTTMLAHEGAIVERVRASDCETAEKAVECARRVLGSLDKIRAAR
jgi:hypothetical protein